MKTKQETNRGLGTESPLDRSRKFTWVLRETKQVCGGRYTAGNYMGT